MQSMVITFNRDIEKNDKPRISSFEGVDCDMLAIAAKHEHLSDFPYTEGWETLVWHDVNATEQLEMRMRINKNGS